MPVGPITVSFLIAGLGALVTSSRSESPLGTMFLAATLVAATTGLMASALQFLPSRFFVPLSIVAAAVVAFFVSVVLYVIEYLGFGQLHAVTIFVWPLAALVALLMSRSWGMGLPTLRRRRTSSR
jgi:hypothetical protein